MRIRELEKTFTDQLTILYDFQEARNIAWLAVHHVCHLTRIEYLGAKHEELSPGNEALLLQYLEKLKTGMPLQYVLGETEFYGLRFKVNPSVLIPRPETEELVDWILKDVKYLKGENNSRALSILDIGTGSGCIPIALKANLPGANITGIDISPEALNTAIENSVLNNVDVKFLKEDVFDLLSKEEFKTRFDLIVSNPPYVTLKEKVLMHRNVVEFEPHTALFVDNDDPLLFYKTIANFASNRLEHNGRLFLEINESYGAKTLALLQDNGFHNIEVRHDLRGRERMIRAEKTE